MIKVGQVVKLKNPRKKGEDKRRWRVANRPVFDINNITFNPVLGLRRLDTATHRLERLNESDLIPISFWEKIWKRY